MAEKFSKLNKTYKLMDPRSLMNPKHKKHDKIYAKVYKSSYLSKTSANEKILQVAREKSCIKYKGKL